MGELGITKQDFNVTYIETINIYLIVSISQGVSSGLVGWFWLGFLVVTQLLTQARVIRGLTAA